MFFMMVYWHAVGLRISNETYHDTRGVFRKTTP